VPVFLPIVSICQWIVFALKTDCHCKRDDMHVTASRKLEVAYHLLGFNTVDWRA